MVFEVKGHRTLFVGAKVFSRTRRFTLEAGGFVWLAVSTCDVMCCFTGTCRGNRNVLKIEKYKEFGTG